jgi:FkbM family methyltransferase
MKLHLRVISAITKFVYLLISLLPLAVKARLLDKITWTTFLDYNKKIHLKVDSQWSYYRRNSCAKEPETIIWLQESLKSGDVFLDIGANVGAYSLVAATIMKKGTIICVEPSFSTYKTLCSNIILIKNQYPEITFIPFNIALSDNAGIIEFTYSDITSGAARHGEGLMADKIMTPALTADMLIEIFNIVQPNVIKLDVDGPEVMVLSGAIKILSQKSMKSILIEVDQQSSKEVDKIMSHYKYTKILTQTRGSTENRVYSK